jgi:predicted AlkP superfamily phosphohydrolase/phosphomutase
MKRTALIIGWDGVPFPLAKELLDKGELPNLEKLSENGYFGPLRTVPYVMSSCAWSTFLTGKNAGKHGIYDFYSNEFHDDSYFREPINATARESEEIYKTLNRNGKNVGSVNMPMTYPVPEIDEFMISGMITPSLDSDRFVHPDSFLDGFEGLQNYRIEPEGGKDPETRDEYLDEMYEIIEDRMDLMVYSVERSENLDVFFAVFTCPDRLSHYFWHFLDEEHPYRKNESDEDLEKYSQVIPDLYRALDEKLGELVNKFEDKYGDDLLISVISDHGMTSLRKVVHMNKWLSKKGYLEFKEDWSGDLDDEIDEMLDDKVEYIFGKVNWEETTAYSMGKRGAIYLNLEGREPKGSVSPDRYDEVIDDLLEDLWNLNDPNTGEELVEEIHTRDDMFHGDNIEDAPDVLVSLSEGHYPFGYAFEMDKPDKIVSDNDWHYMPFVTGIEDGDGIVCMSGDMIDSAAPQTEFGLIDYAPTLLYYLGLPIPEDMDGRVGEELFTKSFRDENKPEYIDEGGVGVETKGLSNEDEQRIKDRLDDLGYM